jgi:hypothetical protein
MNAELEQRLFADHCEDEARVIHIAGERLALGSRPGSALARVALGGLRPQCGSPSCDNLLRRSGCRIWLLALLRHQDVRAKQARWPEASPSRAGITRDWRGWRREDWQQFVIPKLPLRYP